MQNAEKIKNLSSFLTFSEKYGILVDVWKAVLLDKSGGVAMVRQQNKLDFRFVWMYDCYKNLLTDRQRDVMELYYNEDYSLSEIAEILKISRQAVNDSLRHSEAILMETEQKLGFAERFDRIRESLTKIRDNARSACPDFKQIAEVAENALESA